MEEKVVIIGGGQGAFSAASQLRDLGYQGDVTIVAAEKELPYQRPPLSKAYLLGKTDAERLSLRPRDYFDRHRIGLILGKAATKVDRTTRQVELADGSSLSYDKLVFATGSRARVLTDKMSHTLSGIFVLRSLSDAEKLKAVLSGLPRRVFVIGGGFIGLEVASISCQLGHSVTLVEASSQILSRVACTETAEIILSLHRQHGVDVRTGVTVNRLLSREGVVTGAVLSDETEVEADVVLAGVGGIANDELAAKAGLQVSGGIVVDRYCQTSDSRIFAIGDCAAFSFEGRMLRIESVQNATEQGVVVARILAGSTTVYDPVPWFWSDQFNSKLQTVGIAKDYQKIIVLHGPRPGSSAIWYFRDGKAIAVDTINDARTHMAARRVFSAGRSFTIDQVASLDFNPVSEAQHCAQVMA